MATQDFRALFAPDAGRDFKSLFAPDEISEEEANRTLTPEERARVVQDDPKFGAGLTQRMDEYRGLSPKDAAAKYRAGWAETVGNVYDTVTDPNKLASAAGSAVKAGAHAVAHPRETAQRIGNYYYENPDAAVTDAAFAAFPGRQGVAALGRATQRAPSTAMPRASVRGEAELLSTGGKRMEEAKLNPARVEADAIAAPLASFREATKTVGLETPLVKAIAKKLENAYTPRKPDAMSRVTGVQPKPRPPVSLTDLHGYQQALDKFINGAGKTNGRINSQGFEAITLKKSIDKIIDNHSESGSFKIGKHEVHRGKQSQELSDLLERAQRRRTWQNGDEAGALNAEIAQFLGKKANRYKFTKAQRAKLEKIGGRNAQALLGAMGSRTVSGAAAGRLLEMSLGIPPGMTWPLGNAARQSRNASTIKAFEQFQEEIRAGGPVGR
jgi:hypothetical protein